MLPPKVQNGCNKFCIFLIQFSKPSSQTVYITTKHSWNQFLFPYCKIHTVQHIPCLQPLCALPAIYLYHISPNRLNMPESLHNNMPFAALLNVCILEINSLQTDYACLSVFCDMQHPARTVACLPNKCSGKLYFLHCHQLQNHSEAYRFNRKMYYSTSTHMQELTFAMGKY